MQITNKTVVEQELSESEMPVLESPTQKLKNHRSEPPELSTENTPSTEMVEAEASNMGEVDEPTSPSLRVVMPSQLPEQSNAQNERFIEGVPEVDIVTTTHAVAVQPKQAHQKAVQRKVVKQKALPVPTMSKRDAANARVLQERCRQLSLSLFFQENSSLRSIGFTSAIKGEGKTFLTLMMANALMNDSSSPVTLLECNWDHPCFDEYFKVSQTPGLAEWLRGECDESEIRHELDTNLTVIPAGNGKRDAVKLVQQMRQKGLLNMFSRSDELFVVDLPPVVSSTYGSLAASIAEALVIVVRAGVTTDPLLSEACAQLKDAPIQGVILNQVASHIPRWIQQLL